MHDDDYEPGHVHRMSPSDVARRVFYVTFPVNYVDENSSVEQLLWQHVLEQRAIRSTVWCVGAIVATLLLPIAIVAVLSLL